MNRAAMASKAPMRRWGLSVVLAMMGAGLGITPLLQDRGCYVPSWSSESYVSIVSPKDAFLGQGVAIKVTVVP